MFLAEIIKKLQASRLKIFRLSDLKKLLSVREDNTAYKIAEKLIKKDFLLPLKKGLYASAFRPPMEFEIANHLCLPSYVSLESALNFYGILSQFPYTTTSITPKRTRCIEARERIFVRADIQRTVLGDDKRKGFFDRLPRKGPY